jgi:hypothetical protein
MVHRACPVPVGSRLLVTRYRHCQTNGGQLQVKGLLAAGGEAAVEGDLGWCGAGADTRRAGRRRLGGDRGGVPLKNSSLLVIHEAAVPVKGLLLLFFLVSGCVLGRRVCGVGGSRLAGGHPPGGGCGLDADAVRVMLLMPETQNCWCGCSSFLELGRFRSGGWEWSRFTRFRPGDRRARPRCSVAGHPSAMGAWCAATVTGWGQSDGRPRHPGVGVRPAATAHLVTSEPAHAACRRPGSRARMCPSRSCGSARPRWRGFSVRPPPRPTAPGWSPVW